MSSLQHFLMPRPSFQHAAGRFFNRICKHKRVRIYVVNQVFEFAELEPGDHCENNITF